MKTKPERIEMLNDCIEKIKKLALSYKPGSPQWSLINLSLSIITSVHYLEHTEISDQSMGIKNND